MAAYFCVYALEGSKPSTLFVKDMRSHKLKDLLPGDSDYSHNIRGDCYSQIGDRLHSIYQFQSVSKNYESDMHLMNSEEGLPYFDIGNFKPDISVLKDAHCQNEGIQIVWLAVTNIGFVLILDEKESLVDAEITLRLIIQHLHEICRGVIQPNEFVTKSDKIHFMLDKFVSGGKLAFLNHRTVRQFERESEVVLKTKGN